MAGIVVAGTELVTVPFETIAFRAGSGQSPDVKVTLGEITFGGALRYVHTLVELIDDLHTNGNSRAFTEVLVRETLEALALGA